MLIKSADDKSKRIALFEDLKNSPMLDSWQKDRLRDELQKLRRGIQGEKDSAHYLNNYYKDSPNHAVIHDLRIEVEGETGRKKLVCVTCSCKISYAEGKFCWNNEKRFNGNQYCRDHQATFC